MSWFRYGVAAISGVLVPLLLTAPPVMSQVLENPTSAEIAEGERVFLKNCALCHGGDATGGRGPDLTRGFFRHATSDEQLFDVVQGGIRGTGMPWTGLSDRKAGQLVAFIRSLSGSHGPVQGDAQKGRALFFGSATCSTCHTVNGEGSRQGPDLSWVGWHRAPDYLRTAVLDPNADVDPRWWTAKVTTLGGEQIGGILVDEDQFTVRLLDVNDGLHAFAKSELEAFERGKNSRMPSFRGVLSEEDLSDVVAYLAGLRGGVTN